MSESMYRTIRLPKNLVDKVEEEVRESDMGYRSIAEYIAEAIRDKIGKRELEVEEA